MTLRQLPRLPGLLAAVAAAGALLLGVSTTPSLAATPAPKPAATPAAAPLGNPTAGDHLPPSGPSNADPASPAAPLDHRLTAAQLPPLSPPVPAADTASARTPRSRALAQAAPAAAASCTAGDFSGRSGADLVSFVKASTPDCINTLFSASGSNAYWTFRQAQMATVADALRTAASTYPGDNSTGALQLVLFLRAGYFVHYTSPSTVGNYDAALTDAVARGLDAFVASPHFTDATESNAPIAGEALVLTDSADLQGRYLATYRQVLNGYTSAYNDSPPLVNFVNKVFTPLWRGHQNPAYVAAVTADPGIIDTLDAFALNHRDVLGTANSFLASNAGVAMSRFVKYPALQPKVRPLIKGLLDISSMTGPTATLWVGAANSASSYDQAQCSYYDVCDLSKRLVKAVLPTSHTCDTRTILSQDLTAAELAAVCDDLKGEDAYYHRLVRDNGPIPGQYESTVQIVVFASREDYQTYAGAMYNVPTDNGGITMNGDPDDPANLPYTLMYRHPNENGFTARIWNLNHEYAHVLDSRYNMKGKFGQQISYPALWWIEGSAEYASYAYRNITDTRAMAEAAKHSYPLSSLFQSTYDNSDTNRTYMWGYLAARYMIERYPTTVQTVLSKYRTGDYAGAYNYVNSIGTLYDSSFDSWLDRCAAGDCLADGTPTADFDSAVSGLSVKLTDRSTQTGNGSIASRVWDFGDGTTSTEAAPTKTYAKAGTYKVALTVTSSTGQIATLKKYVTVSVPVAQPCTGSSRQEMGQFCYRTDRAAGAGQLDYLYIYMPAGTTTLTVTTTGGTGTAYLYYNPSTYATAANATASSTNNGTTQSLTVTNTTSGWRYISLYGATAFSGVTITTQY
ncbi:collagenase [Kitasatospora griseola]|uniref:collagenase n=1 Tax=Kitasatospora griseola TaxID=2064 RepID=UPI0009F97D16|nr:collagenase [Kitasatospora griseola]